jgi:hypothetical protein
MSARSKTTAIAAALLALVVAWPGTQPGFVVDADTGEIDKPEPTVASRQLTVEHAGPAVPPPVPPEIAAAAVIEVLAPAGPPAALVSRPPRPANAARAPPLGS